MATDKYGYRKYLNEKGFKDDDITYDNGAVKVKGQFFANATPEADGSTYNSRGNLDSLYRAYQTQNMPTYQDRSNALLSNVQERLNKPTTPFQYNPYSDPQYQSALQAAQQGAATQQGNTLARLRSMGQGKSSYSEGVAQQIGQQAVADVNARQLPQMMQQAYGRYMDEQQMGRQNALDLLGLGQQYNSLYQQGLDNDFRGQQLGEQRRQNNLDAALRVGQQTGRLIQPKQDYGLLFNQTEAPLNMEGQQFQYQQARDQIADEQYKQKFDEDVRRFGLQYAMDQAQLSNQIRQQNEDNVRQDRQLDLQERKFDFDREQATAPRPQSASDYKTSPDFASDYQYVANNPEQAKQLLQANAAEFIKEYGYDGYLALLRGLPKEDQDDLLARIQSASGG